MGKKIKNYKIAGSMVLLTVYIWKSNWFLLKGL